MPRTSYVVNYPTDEAGGSKFRDRIPQYLVAVAVMIGGFCLGNCLGYSSPALPNLKSRGDFLDIENSHLSWIGSLLTIGALCGAAFSGYSIERIGRKWTLLAVGIPLAIGWLTIALAQYIWMLYVGRFLKGFCAGALSLVGPVYLSEISQSDIRGFLGGVFQVSSTVGILFTYIVGSMTSWDVLAGICGLVPLIFTLCTVFIPESPRYLLSMGNTAEAIKSLSWLRSCDSHNPSQSALEEMDEIQESIRRSVGDSQQRNILSDLRTLPVLKPLLITLGLMLFNQFCGVNPVGFYTVAIFEEAEQGLDAYLSSIIVGIVQVIFTTLASAFVDKAGRRVLLLISFATMSLSLVTLGTFFRMKYESSFSNELLDEFKHWIPLVSMIVYKAAYFGGVGCLVWTVMSEILPTHIIGFASGLATTFNWTLAFLTTKFFHGLNDSLGIHNTFLLFAAACALGFLFTLTLVPETKGISLDRIQKENFQQCDKKSTVELATVTASTADLV